MDLDFTYVRYFGFLARVVRYRLLCYCRFISVRPSVSSCVQMFVTFVDRAKSLKRFKIAKCNL